MARVAINGLGRIGRAAFKIILDTPNLELVAVNDTTEPEELAYLIEYDTVYRHFNKKIEGTKNSLIVEGKEYKVFGNRNPEELPWGDLGIDIVLECTGAFTNREGLEKHLKGGAKKAVLSAPAKGGDVDTIVLGVNKPSESASIISCASCTTNCITPVAEIMARRIGVKKAIMTTIHAYTGSQGLVDGSSKKIRRGRAAAANFVPTTTGAAIATTKVLPDYEGKFDGVAVRGPVPVGSIADLIFVTEKSTSVEEINQVFKEEAEGDRYQDALGYSEDLIVSSDIIGRSETSIIDLSMTKVVDGDLVKVMSWYDNEWGYASQMVRAVAEMGKTV